MPIAENTIGAQGATPENSRPAIIGPATLAAEPAALLAPRIAPCRPGGAACEMSALVAGCVSVWPATASVIATTQSQIQGDTACTSKNAPVVSRPPFFNSPDLDLGSATPGTFALKPTADMLKPL